MSDQVLTDQMQTIISDLVKGFTSISHNYLLTLPGPILHLNGDLRALLLVNTARPEHLTPTLLAALKVLKKRVEDADEAMKASEKDASEEEDNSKAKKAEEEDKEAEPAPSTSTASEQQQPTTPSSKKAGEDTNGRSKLREAYAVFLKTLTLLVEMCENKIKMKESAAAAAAEELRKRKEAESKIEDEDDNE